MLVNRPKNPKKRVKRKQLLPLTICDSCGGTGRKYVPGPKPCLTCKGLGGVPFITGK